MDSMSLKNLKPYAYSAGTAVSRPSSRDRDAKSTTALTSEPKMASSVPAFPSNHQALYWIARYVVILLVVGIPLAIPVIVFRHDQDLEDDLSQDTRQYRQLLFYLFAWMLTSWLGGMVSYGIASGLPYLFRFIARFV
jgi:Sec-independent protein secretion pathway component TatC